MEFKPLKIDFEKLWSGQEQKWKGKNESARPVERETRWTKKEASELKGQLKWLQTQQVKQKDQPKVLGIAWDQDQKKWLARLSHKNQPVFVGRYDSFERAVYSKVAKKLELEAE